MGRALIIGNDHDGQYDIEVKMERSRIDKWLSEIGARLGTLATELLGLEKTLSNLLKELENFYKKDKDYRLKNQAEGISIMSVLVATRKKLQLKNWERVSLEKKRAYLSSADMDDPTMPVWCADYSLELFGNCATIEVPGIYDHINGHGNIQLMNGWDDQYFYDAARDGQLQQVKAGTPSSVAYNWAIQPGMLKWRPTFRYGVIDSIEKEKAEITLEETTDPMGRDLNQSRTLSEVEFNYMDCDDRPFMEGDTVLVGFEGRDWAQPKVVGYKDHPQPCVPYVVVGIGDPLNYNADQKASGMDYVTVFDPVTNQVARITDPISGAQIVLPCRYHTILNWLNSRLQKDCPDDELYFMQGYAGEEKIDYTKTSPYASLNDGCGIMYNTHAGTGSLTWYMPSVVYAWAGDLTYATYPRSYKMQIKDPHVRAPAKTCMREEQWRTGGLSIYRIKYNPLGNTPQWEAVSGTTGYATVEVHEGRGRLHEYCMAQLYVYQVNFNAVPNTYPGSEWHTEVMAACDVKSEYDDTALKLNPVGQQRNGQFEAAIRSVIQFAQVSEGYGCLYDYVAPSTGRLFQGIYTPQLHYEVDERVIRLFMVY